MKKLINRAAIIAVAAFLSGCAAGVVVDTTASVVGGIADGVVSAAEWTADLVVD